MSTANAKETSCNSFVIRSASIGAAATAAAVAAPSVYGQTQIRWRLASSFPKSLDTLFGCARVLRQAGHHRLRPAA